MISRDAFRWSQSCVFAILTLLIATPLTAQGIGVRDPMQGYLRTMQLAGAIEPTSLMLLPLASADIARSDAVLAGPWRSGPAVDRLRAWSSGLASWDVEARSFYNSPHPSRTNDGSVWQGRGLTLAVEGGGSLQWKGLSIALRPSVRWHANDAFSIASHDLQGQSEWSYPWRPIDLPQRFGSEPFWAADLGQSELRLATGPVAFGLSSRDAWWGPGQKNAIVLGNAAGGVPRVFIGSSRPVDAAFARFEWRWIFGRLSRSDWFAPGTADPGRYLTGAIVTLSPEAVSGLHLGASLVSYGRPSNGGLSVDDYLSLLVPTDTSTADQLGSVFLRWVLPRSGFEVYAEWARNDRSVDFQDFVLEPQHGQGYTLGIEKLFDWGRERRVSILAELTHLEAEGTSRLRDNPTFYAHSVALEGYTHNGQLLGAVVGPGGSQQYLGATVYGAQGRGELWVRRAVRDNDAFYEWADTTSFDGCLFCQHDVSFEAGADVVLFHDSWETGWSVALARQLNRWFTGHNVWNVSLGVRVRRSGSR